LNTSKAVVCVHGAGLDRREFLRTMPILHKAGYSVLLFDCREHGISSSSFNGISFGLREHNDVIHAEKYMKNTLRFEKIAVLGTSQGGTSVLLASAKEDGIDAVIAENPFTSLDELISDVIDQLLKTQPDWTQDTGIASYLISVGDLVPMWFRTFLKFAVKTKVVLLANEGQYINPIDVIHNLNQPVLLIHGTADQLIPLHHSQKLFRRAQEPKHLWEAEGGDHSAIYNRYPKEYEQNVIGFLQQYIG